MLCKNNHPLLGTEYLASGGLTAIHCRSCKCTHTSSAKTNRRHWTPYSSLKKIHRFAERQPCSSCFSVKSPRFRTC